MQLSLYCLLLSNTPMDKKKRPGGNSARKRMTPVRNITRFTYDSAAFQGWRLAICRYHVHYIRYFSDREYGGAQEAFSAALAERERVYANLSECPYDPKKVLESCRESAQAVRRPRGMKSRRRRSASE